MSKTAFITGFTGQDGAYLAHLLLRKGYIVHGLVRRTSQHSVLRLGELCDVEDFHDRLFLHYGDMTDSLSLASLIEEIRPDEVYNLAAQSHVLVSFEMPFYSCDVDALGTLRVLEAVRQAGLAETCRVYQASTSELFGKVHEVPQRETTPFHPRSPYGVAKLFAYWMTVNYRESYGMFASNGILFNHESPLRGEEFVTRKITLAVARIAHGLQDRVVLGNLDARRDWGHARDFVQAMWLILQARQPGDFIIATGQQRSVREFVERAFAWAGIPVAWSGAGVDEVGVARVPVLGNPGQTEERVVVAISPEFFRPAEVETLLGSPEKARQELGWVPETTFDTLVEEMMDHDWKLVEAGGGDT